MRRAFSLSLEKYYASLEGCQESDPSQLQRAGVRLRGAPQATAEDSSDFSEEKSRTRGDAHPRASISVCQPCAL
ncbi:MAG: hypothetical protein UY44_C0008G0008 [Candidatus Kaiserbacteria bacterium GW2011_GWA2_49_19]|uniref:Uncharacterized protein n=1 Tax=Candidatus Kaiserbacteria bacterium GW2011_GWA2_49_19 TaxID=1618669 RepID=A0A0G1VQ97_9BACT|nr:MAG: hypothetical protein UY44_C0008G0008 [Candidatus Kaiserbacteria bacterium GW2011_GWA2_49_19]